jgi:triacylglycerol lipase
MSRFYYFRPGYGGHSNTNAYLLSLLTYYIYDKKDVAGNPSIPGRGSHSSKFRSLFQDLSNDNPFNVRTQFSGATEWAVLSNSKLVIVVFRGTDEDLIPEWKSNITYQLRTAPKSWGGNVRVHSGFYSTLSGVYQTIRQEVRSRNDNGRIPVYLTGHSRGAALATLCAYRFQKVGGVPVAGVYVFGAPRVGTVQGWRDQYKIAGLWDMTFRWVNYRDPAHKVPDYGDARPWRQNVTNKYAHIGRLNLFSKSGSATYNHSNPDYEPGATIVPTDGGYHAMNQYCIRLFNRLSGRSRRSQNNPGYLTKHDAKVPLPV